MYTQYTVKYDLEKWNFMSGAKSRFETNYMHFYEETISILRFYLEETISSYLVSN